MNVLRIVPAAAALLFFAACGARVTVGFVDGPDGGDLDPEEGGPTPPPFSLDAARREAATPSPGCDDKNCGALCSPCKQADAAGCPPVSVFHVCSGMRQCLPQQPGCIVIQEVDGAAPAGYVPCAGRACGAACTSCPPASPGCSPVVGRCQVDGVCAAGSADCR